jgi:hypothetical protein
MLHPSLSAEELSKLYGKTSNAFVKERNLFDFVETVFEIVAHPNAYAILGEPGGMNHYANRNAHEKALALWLMTVSGLDNELAISSTNSKTDKRGVEKKGEASVFVESLMEVCFAIANKALMFESVPLADILLTFDKTLHKAIYSRVLGFGLRRLTP